MEPQAKALAILENLWWRNGISFWDYVALRTAIEGEEAHDSLGMAELPN